jgi:hypothetical protein
MVFAGCNKIGKHLTDNGVHYLFPANKTRTRNSGGGRRFAFAALFFCRTIDDIAYPQESQQ